MFDGALTAMVLWTLTVPTVAAGAAAETFDDDCHRVSADSGYDLAELDGDDKPEHMVVAGGGCGSGVGLPVRSVRAESDVSRGCVRVELDVGSEYIERADDHPAARGDVSVWVHMTTGRSAARVTARAGHAPPAWCGRPVASSPPPPRSP